MNFDRLARHYDWMEALTAGNLMQDARIHWLDALRGRREILSAGEGHGRFAASCLARHPQAKLTCLESSAAMIARAKARTPATDQVEWRLVDVRTWEAIARYDALATCFFLDCFPPGDLEQVVGRLAGAATRDAVWINVDFAVPADGPARWRAVAVHWVMYRFFRMAVALPARRITPPDPLLIAQGFRLTARRNSNWGLIHSDLWIRAG